MGLDSGHVESQFVTKNRSLRLPSRTRAPHCVFNRPVGRIRMRSRRRLKIQ